MALNLWGAQPAKREATNRRPKGADVDRPEGFIKRNLRRTIRRALQRNLANAPVE